LRRITSKVHKAKSSVQSIMLEIRSRSLSHNEFSLQKIIPPAVIQSDLLLLNLKFSLAIDRMEFAFNASKSFKLI